MKIQKGSLKTFMKVFDYVRPYSIFLVCSIGFAIVSSVVMLYIPILFGNGIDWIVSEGQVDFHSLMNGLKVIMIWIVVAAVSLWLMNIINNHLTYRIVQDLRTKAIRKIQHLPISFVDSHGIGDMTGRLIADMDQLSDGLLLGFTQVFSGSVTIVVTLVFMFRIHVEITALVVVLTPLSFLVAKFIASRSYTMFQLQTRTRGTQTSLIEEMIGNQKIVQAFGYENRASQRFDTMNQQLQDYSRKAVFFSSLTNPSTRFLNGVIYALVCLLGSMMILDHRLSVGGLTILLVYANQYMRPFNDISAVITEMQNALACANRVFELLETEDEIPDTDRELTDISGQVDIDRIVFGYDKPLIKDFSFHVEPGQRVAIVGPTGCGKTTFINLLMRFYDIQEGCICIDGTNIYDVSRYSLRKCYGMVLQDTWLKHGTIRENIAFGKPEANEEEIIEAAKKAHSYEFIRRLPDRLDTVIREDDLSQGQKQLLCITRVMLSLPPMLILDEATSNIDTRTEWQIQEAFEQLMKGRTSFVIAHRLSTIQHADLILVMKEGRIIEQGDHESLLAQNGFYTHLYNSQFENVS